MLTVSNEISLNTESKQSDSSSSQNEHPLSFEKITSSNLSQFRQQNSVLFPILYPESFYRNIINSKEVSAYLVYYNDTCIGSYSTRLEPISRWKEISSGRMIDNFNPVSETENNCNSKTCYIMTLGVLATYRRLGIGAEILEKIIQMSSTETGTQTQTDKNNDNDNTITTTGTLYTKCQCIGLHVHVENKSALRFYERRGFKVIGKVENYYKKITPNSAYILELDWN